MLYHLVIINHIVVYDIIYTYIYIIYISGICEKKHMNYSYNYQYTLDLFGHGSKYVNIIIPHKNR